MSNRPNIRTTKRKYRLSDFLSPRIFRNKKVLAGSTCVAAVLGGSWILQGTRYAVWRSSTKIATSNDGYLDTPTYIYLSTCASNLGENSDLHECSVKHFWWPWRKRPSIRLHWKLIKLAKSKHHQVRHFAVKALADLPGLGDAECLEIAQASDIQLSVILAKIPGIDLRFFLPPPRAPYKFKSLSLEASLRILLCSLPAGDKDSCIQYFTLQAGISLDEWNFGGEDDPNRRARRVPLKTVAQQSLRALLSHSLIPEHRSLIISHGGLLLLHRVCEECPDNIEFQSLAAQILGNLAIDEKLHKQIFMSGWVGILAKWMKSSHNQLVLPAARVLANLETDLINHTTFDDGIYVLHPSHRYREGEMHADVVFIHGLLGGAFKTWRQDDCAVHQKALSQVLSDQNGYTYCWPRDWLARDCPSLRLLAVDYESHLSDWRSSCSPGRQRQSLSGRSQEMMVKLMAAGLGQRPIVWVTHSMGGLMVKLMLLKAAASEDPKEKALLSQTKGIVFYGVPHKGSALANLNSSTKFLLLPSAEVRDLRESPQLLELNENFKEIIDKNQILCLSFAETANTQLGLKWSMMLVLPESANPGYGEFHMTQSDHLSICKPDSRQSPLYSLLLDFLHKCVHSNIMERTIVTSDVETVVAMGLVQ